MNDTTIQMIAQAIIANTKVIQSLIEALPHDVKVAVAGAANVAPAAPVAPAPAPVVQAVAAPAPIPAPVAAPVAPMPAPPVFAPAAAPVAAPAGEKAPFTDAKGLIDFVMSAYKALGPQKGSGIQSVLTSLGYQNINDVNPAHYDALYAGVKALA
jgi:hypothetical protein